MAVRVASVAISLSPSVSEPASIATLWSTGDGLSYSIVTVPALAVSLLGSKMSEPSAGELTLTVLRPPGAGGGSVSGGDSVVVGGATRRHLLADHLFGGLRLLGARAFAAPRAR